MKKNLCLLLITLCAACTTLPGTGHLPVGYSETNERWQVKLDGQTATADHQIWLNSDLVTLLKGSPVLDPTTIQDWLKLQGAQNPQCLVEPHQGGLRFNCQYGFSPEALGTARKIPFSFMQILPALLNDHPILIARGLVLRWSARIEVKGAFTQVPDPLAGSAGPGHFVQYHYQLTRTNVLEGAGYERIPPGLPARQHPAAAATYLPEYTPAPLAWMAFGLGLTWALWVLWRTFPVRAVVRSKPLTWQPQTSHLPQPLRWVILRLVALVNWLLHAWPRLLNSLAATTSLAVSLGLFISARSLAVLDESSVSLRDWLSRLPILLPLASAFDLTAWAGWIYILAGASLLFLAIAIGLFLRKEFSRVLICAILISLAGFMLLSIPARLLAPALFPFYYEVTLSSFIVSFGSVLLLWHAFSHPLFRIFQQQDGGN